MLVDDMKKSLHYHKYTFAKMSTVESKKVKKLNKFFFKPFFIYFDCKDFRVSSHIRAHAFLVSKTSTRLIVKCTIKLKVDKNCRL